MEIKKSLYNKSSIKKAIEGAYSITLITEYGPVKGILKEPISYSVNANWSPLGLEGLINSLMASNPLLQTIDTALDTINAAAGSSFTNSGIFTKLFYKNSGRLKITPSFRVLDYDGSGVCTRVAMLLSTLCIPKIGESINLRKMSDTAIENAKKLPLVGNVVAGTEEAINKAVDEGNMLAKNITTGYNAIVDSTANWTTAPKPVSIVIGDWLAITTAVVEDVQVNFSYECTKSGPIWVDFSLSLETQENLTLDDKGKIVQFGLGDIKGRVTFSNEKQTTNANIVFE